jgi:hypothetical protein
MGRATLSSKKPGIVQVRSGPEFQAGDPHSMLFAKLGIKWFAPSASQLYRSVAPTVVLCSGLNVLFGEICWELSGELFGDDSGDTM